MKALHSIATALIIIAMVVLWVQSFIIPDRPVNHGDLGIVIVAWWWFLGRP